MSTISSSSSLLPNPQIPLRRRLRPIAAVSTSTGVRDHIEVLKAAAKTRQVPKTDVLAALAAIKDGHKEVDPSGFLETLGGIESPGRTWMLIFTAEGPKLEKGRYFPITAVQRFDATVSEGF